MSVCSLLPVACHYTYPSGLRVPAWAYGRPDRRSPVLVCAHLDDSYDRQATAVVASIDMSSSGVTARVPVDARATLALDLDRVTRWLTAQGYDAARQALAIAALRDAVGELASGTERQATVRLI